MIWEDFLLVERKIVVIVPKKSEWGRTQLEQHQKAREYWYYRALSSLLCALYDKCDVKDLLFRDGDISKGKSSSKNHIHHHK